MDLTDADLARLEALARAATPDRRAVGHGDQFFRPLVTLAGGGKFLGFFTTAHRTREDAAADAEFVAATDPQTVLALVTEVKRRRRRKTA